jgi:DNA-binding NarL/FixJ family response regulator
MQWVKSSRAELSEGEMHRIRILAVDDHPLLRDGIAALISAHDDMVLVAEASNGRQAIELFRVHAPDVTLMDLQMRDKNGIEAITAIRKLSPDARIIVLTTYSGDVQVTRALEAGARAYLLKNLLHTELLETIRAVHAGKKTMSPTLAADLAERFDEDGLTEKEVDVLRLIAEGHANKEIAARLSITEETVKSRVKNILSKLDANDRTHAAIIGVKRGIITV